MARALKAKKTVLILQINGAPCSGKGTMIKMLMAYFQKKKIVHKLISTSSFLKARAESEGEYADDIKTCMQNGTTVPGAITASVIAPAVSDFIKALTDKKYVIIFDGYLRTHEQVDSVFQIEAECKSHDLEIILLPAFVLNVSDAVLIARQQSQRVQQQDRSDHDKFEARLAAYTDGTVPTIDCYSKQLGVGTVLVDADPVENETFKNLITALGGTIS